MPATFANRYAPVENASHGPCGPRLARDVAFDRLVAFEPLGGGFADDAGAQEKLAHALGVLHTLSREHLVRYFGFEETADEVLLIREWVPGFSLLDLLRRRRGVSVRQYVCLLCSLPETLDRLAKGEVPLPRSLFEKVLFTRDEVDGPASLDESLSAHSDDLSSLRLKFNPLSMGDFMSARHENLTVFAPRRPAMGRNLATHLLSRLLYEVFGGHGQAEDRFPPLAALNEEGNARLRSCLHGDYADCATFWSDFVRVVDPAFSTPSATRMKRTSRPQAWEIAGAVPQGVPAANVLRLIPDHAEAIPIHLIARSTFDLGRAHHEADFTTRLLPENEANYERTGRISRVHVRGEIIDGILTLRDGNGRSASANGSWFSGHLLPSDPPTILSHRGILNLAQEYRIEVIPLFQDHVSDCRFNGFAGETGFVEQETCHIADGLHGSVTFIPLDGRKSLCDAIWLFSGIGFGLDLGGSIVWDYDGQGGSPGALLYYRNRFWIKNMSLPVAVMAGEILLQCNQVARLVPGQELRIGSLLYFVH